MLIQTKQPNQYDIAVNLLNDLGDLTARSNGDAEFQAGLAALRDRHARKPSLLRGLRDAGL